MGRDSCVVKASNIFYINSSQPDRLYQTAEEYYRRAEEYERGHLYHKARVSYQKAEEYFQRSRDAYRTRKQTDRARRQADEARRQADEARKQAGKAGVVYAPQAAESPRSAAGHPTVSYLQSLTRRQTPAPKIQASQPQESKPCLPAAAVQISNRPPPKAADIKRGDGCADGPAPPPDTAVGEIPAEPERNERRPISWKGKKHI